MTNVALSVAWEKLQAHSEQFTRKEFSLGKLVNNPGNYQRTSPCTIEHGSLLFDYSRNFLNDETLDLLAGLAEERGMADAIAAMFAGEVINRSEQRPALHIALREQDESRLRPEVRDTLAAMDRFVTAIHSGEWRGFDGQAIRNVVNIGIGGSDLGPAMAVRALQAFASAKVKLHFVANVDPAHLANTLADLEPATTLFIVSSKSFHTLETLENARAARHWLLQAATDDGAMGNHFLAISANPKGVAAFGIAEANTFPMWDWVGGRYSMWSAIGLPIALAVGMDNFRQLLSGAYVMDRHFAEAPLSENIPVLMGLLTSWYRACFDAHSQAVTPYCQDLEHFPAFLQQ
ncbi:MAG: glucose-6-phosphate isomerase, partial [Gammaproteobacteria bacterium]